jgi:hypothetical protein
MSEIYPAESRDELLDTNFPTLGSYEGAPCLFSHSRFYFENEAGPRFMYCDPDLEAMRGEIDSLLHIARYRSPTAYPAVEHPRFSLSVLTSAALKREAGGILFSLDGSLPSALGQRGLEGGEAAFRYGTPIHSQDHLPYSRRFPLTGFHLLASQSGLYLLYPLPGSVRFLAIHIKEVKAADLVRSGFRRLAKIVRRGAAAMVDPAAPVAVTEIVFGAQAGAGEEFIEISSFAEGPVVAHLNLHSDSDSRSADYILLPRSTLLFARRYDDTLRFADRIRAGNDSAIRTYSLSEYAPSGATPYRSLSYEAARWRDGAAIPGSLAGSTACLSRDICGSPGIHPDYAIQIVQRISSMPSTRQSCTIDDLRLSEFNPFGLITSGDVSSPINISGKFIEFVSQSECETNSIVFFVGGLPLDPGGLVANRGDTILFAANAGHFGPIPPREVTSLRYSAPGDEVAALDLITGERRIWKGANSDLYLYGSRVNGGDSIAAHSLVYGPTGEGYHEPGASGLQPDVAHLHAMSPGFANPAPQLRPVPSISELLPQGSYDSSGLSIPGDEFFELRATNAASTDSMYILEIRRLSDGANFRYRLFNRLERSGDRIAFMNQAPTCFVSASGIISNSGLYLPNAAAEYSLKNVADATLETVQISPLEYDRINAPPRRSLIRIDDTGIFRPADHPDLAAPLCAARTLAAPALPDPYTPFLQLVSDGGQFQRFQLFTTSSAERVRITSGRDPALPEAVTVIDLPDRSFYDFVPPTPGYRVIGGFEFVSSISNPAYFEYFSWGAALAFQTLYPSPLTGESEWLRICSATGFGAVDAATGLYIRDSAFEDRIVPYLQRFPASTPPLPLNGNTLTIAPGECALLIDPDFNPTTQNIPLRAEDSTLWTIESSAAIGNGIASGEGLILYRKEADLTRTPFGSFGLPDTPLPFSINASSGDTIERMTGTVYDRIENYEVKPL